ncbi:MULTISPECIES: OmpA family protein [Sorangium]|uniref:OmpA family protein n=1 Tax=Sorangium atrum TaxID=2995308 RepID=A0ABT5C152_9BACT|nr:OmpA family protein [Sorangium aterium]MDC0680147.1 OmpA family protein [Sorangium aterium]
MRAPLPPRWICGAAALAAAAWAAPASAQEAGPARGLALNRFSPAPAGDRMFGVPSPYAASPNQDGSATLHVMLLGDYAHNPLVLTRQGSDENLGAIVGHQLFLHLNSSLTLWDRLHVNVDLPLAVLQQGDSPAAEGLSFRSPSDVQLGDLRVGLRLRLLGDYFDPFQLAVGGFVWVPTGDRDGSFVGEESVRGLPQILAGGRIPGFVWSAAAGVDLRPAQTFAQVRQGLMFNGGAGVGLLLGSEEQLQIGPEATVSTVLEDPEARNTNVEALLGLRYRFAPTLRDFELGVAAGPGFTSGIGTPDFRAVAMLAYSPEVRRADPDRDKDGIVNEKDACPDVPGVGDPDPKKNGCPPSDRDEDGILDRVDACPDKPGVANDDPKKHGCPPPGDRDKDGITDDVDACPDEAGPANEDPKKHGCPPPPDRDGDGVIDAEDACPDIPGIRTSDPATNGCPGDRDGDTVRDDQDACPDIKGKPDPDPSKNGCPVAVRMTETEIVILQQVQFDTGKATIKKVSDPLLDEVAGVLKEHPEIAKIEVQGHTDPRGGRAYNIKLSQARAESVMKALVQRGVEAERLASKGYGPDVPIADNDTDEGRQKNRRVQFKILEKKPKQQQEAP